MLSPFIIQRLYSMYAVIFATKYFFYTSITLNNHLECCSDGFSIPVLSTAYGEQNFFMHVRLPVIISVCMGFMKKLVRFIFVENFLFCNFYKRYFT